jgi:hypothetical protein
MKSTWCRWVVVAAAVLVVGGIETADAQRALRGLAVAHGSDTDHTHETVENTADWKELDTARHAVADNEHAELSAAASTEDDSVGADHDDDSGSNDTDKSFGFASILKDDKTNAGVVHSARGATGGFTPAQKPGSVVSAPSPTTTAPPMSESAAAAKPITDISKSAIQKDPVAYGVATEKPKPPAMKDSAAAAKPISEISPAAIQKDPEAYGVLTKQPPAPSNPVPIGESAAAAKPIESIDASAIQRDPASYGVPTPAPPVKNAQTGKTPAPADKNPAQKAT